MRNSLQSPLQTIHRMIARTSIHLYVSEARLLRIRPTFSKSVMVTVAVSSLGCTSIHVIEPIVKINGDYYRNTVLRQMLLPDIRYISGDTIVFQQDSAPAQRARATVEFLTRETPEFIPPELFFNANTISQIICVQYS